MVASVGLGLGKARPRQKMESKNGERRKSLVDHDHEELRLPSAEGETKNNVPNYPTTRRRQPHSSDITDDLEINVNFSSASFTSIFGPVVLTMTLAAIAVVNINSPTTQSIGEGLKLYVPPALQPQKNEGAGDAFLKTAGFAALFICFVCIATFFIVLLIRSNCIRCLIGYLLFNVTMLLSFMGGTAVYAVLEMYGVCADWFSFVFIMYNFGIVGVVSVFWQKGMDHFWTNAYLVMVSVILSFEMAQFNAVGEWFPWCICGALALYDLYAVLTPCGPLKLLLDAVQNNEGSEAALSGLLFEADVGQHQNASAAARSQRQRLNLVANNGSNVGSGGDGGDGGGVGSVGSSVGSSVGTRSSSGLEEGRRTAAVALTLSPSPSSPSTQPTPIPVSVPFDHPNHPNHFIHPKEPLGPPPLPKHISPVLDQSRFAARGPPLPRPPTLQRNRSSDDEEDGPRGVKLGLGDFIFYSVLVSTAARHDFITFASCTLVVLLGLGMTLLLLIVAGKALPALPLSILLGVFFYFVGRYTLEPYIDQMTLNAIVI